MPCFANASFGLWRNRWRLWRSGFRSVPPVIGMPGWAASFASWRSVGWAQGTSGTRTIVLFQAGSSPPSSKLELASSTSAAFWAAPLIS